MIRDDLPECGVRFTINLLPGMIFRRYPIEVAPPDGLLGFLTNDHWKSPGVYRDGQWLTQSGKPFKQVPTHWTAMERELGPE
jgi:hypothetical protein